MMAGLFTNLERWKTLLALSSLGLSFLCLLITVPANALEQYTAHGGPVRGLALSNDGRWMVSTSFDYSAVLWSTDSLKEKRRLISHEAAVNTAAFSPDGRFLVTAGDDNTLRVWRMSELLDDKTQPSPRVLFGHTAKIVYLSFSSDGSTLASSSWDHRIGLWSVPEFASLGFLSAHNAPVNATIFSQDGGLLYSAGADGHIRLWDMKTKRHMRSIINTGWGINVLAIDEKRDLLAYGTTSGMLRTHSLRTTQLKNTLLPEGPPVLALTLDSTSGRLAYGTSTGRMMIARLDDGQIEHDFYAVNGPIWAARLMPDSQAIIIAGLDDFITRLPLNAGFPGRVEHTGDRRFHPSKPLDNGARQFARKCSICHSLDRDDRRRAGPTLRGVFGRKAGAVEDYPYSIGLATANLIWSEETIDALFREGPDVVTPGSKMPLQRIPNQKNRRDLIEFLKSNTAVN